MCTFMFPVDRWPVDADRYRWEFVRCIQLNDVDCLFWLFDLYKVWNIDERKWITMRNCSDILTITFEGTYFPMINSIFNEVRDSFISWNWKLIRTPQLVANVNDLRLRIINDKLETRMSYFCRGQCVSKPHYWYAIILFTNYSSIY